jgi:hypothetical protein
MLSAAELKAICPKLWGSLDEFTKHWLFQKKREHLSLQDAQSVAERQLEKRYERLQKAKPAKRPAIQIECDNLQTAVSSLKKTNKKLSKALRSIDDEWDW